MRLRIYVCGPMTGFPGFNFAAFDAARDQIAASGHIAVSPADLDRAIGFDPEATDAIAVDREFMRFAIQRDVDALLQCDAIQLLPGWERSRGARGERAVAEWIGLRIFAPSEPLPPAGLAEVAA